MEAEFPTTSWSTVQRAACVDDESAGLESLNHLLTIYRKPLLHWLDHQMGVSMGEAEDILHEFILAKIILHDFISQADQRKGRFRSFLIQSLKRFTLQVWERNRRKKRRPTEGWVPLEPDSESIPKNRRDPAFDFEAEWALATLRQAFVLVRDRCLQNGEPSVWSVLKSRTFGSNEHGKSSDSYECLVQQYGFESPQQVSSALTTGCRRLRKALDEVIDHYALDESARSQELNHLRVLIADPNTWKRPSAPDYFKDIWSLQSNRPSHDKRELRTPDSPAQRGS